MLLRESKQKALVIWISFINWLLISSMTVSLCAGNSIPKNTRYTTRKWEGTMAWELRESSWWINWVHARGWERREDATECCSHPILSFPRDWLLYVIDCNLPFRILSFSLTSPSHEETGWQGSSKLSYKGMEEETILAHISLWLSISFSCVLFSSTHCSRVVCICMHCILLLLSCQWSNFLVSLAGNWERKDMKTTFFAPLNSCRTRTRNRCSFSCYLLHSLFSFMFSTSVKEV